MAFSDPLKRSEYNRQYRLENKHALKKKRREFYQANKEKIAEKQKIYRQNLPRRIVLGRRAKYYEAHKAKERRRYHATRAFLPWLNAFRGSKQRAKRENIPFTTTREWAEKTYTGFCAVTNIAFVLSTSRHPYIFSPSLDRIMPRLGYTPENTRFVIHAVNALKGAGTDEDMLLIARAIIDNLQN